MIFSDFQCVAYRKSLIHGNMVIIGCSRYNLYVSLKHLLSMLMEPYCWEKESRIWADFRTNDIFPCCIDKQVSILATSIVHIDFFVFHLRTCFPSCVILPHHSHHLNSTNNCHRAFLICTLSDSSWVDFNVIFIVIENAVFPFFRHSIFSTWRIANMITNKNHWLTVWLLF